MDKTQAQASEAKPEKDGEAPEPLSDTEASGVVGGVLPLGWDDTYSPGRPEPPRRDPWSQR